MVVALLLVALLVATGCSSKASETTASATTPSPTRSSTPSATAAPSAPPDPVRGACRDLSYAEAVAPTSEAAATSCAGRHTAETYAVGQLKTVVDGHLLAVDTAAVQQRVATACPRRLARFAGASQEDLRLSMLRAVWFTPTVAESDAGANWYRCDAIVVAHEDALAPLSGGLRGALGTAEGRGSYGMCATAAPGTADFSRVLCRAPHAWRAIRSVDLPRGAYPGEKAVRAAGQEVCDDAARAGAADALDYQWGYEWPTAQQWAAGQTYGRCWAPDQG